MGQGNTKGREAVDLAAVLEGEAKAVATLHAALVHDGFIVVDFSACKELVEEVKAAKPVLQQFFDQPLDSKSPYSENVRGEKDLEGTVYGYNYTENFKEGLRLLSGSSLDLPKWAPTELHDPLQKLTSRLHQTLLQLLQKVSQEVFRMKWENLNVPIVYETKSWAMVDIVSYFNERPQVTIGSEPLNVASHFDPGLLSLNVISDQAGLQFKLRDDTWVDIPVGDTIGVIWTGQYATMLNSKLAPGVHRVIFPQDSSAPHPKRFSVWIEAATAGQDFKNPNTVALLNSVITTKSKQIPRVLIVGTAILCILYRSLLPTITITIIKHAPANNLWTSSTSTKAKPLLEPFARLRANTACP